MAPEVGGKPLVDKEEIVVEGARPDPSKLRILCFHGFRTSGKILSDQVAFAKWSPIIDDIAELVFMDAPWPARGRSDVEEKFAGPYYEWYQSNEDWSEAYGVEETMSHITDYISLHGPFDGIFAFSQGAVLAAAIMGLFEKGMGPEMPTIKFLILVGGGQTKAKFFEHSFTKPIMCPSLHMIGDKDFMKETGESLLGAFKDPTVIRHPFRHVVPRLGANDGKILKDFLLKQLEVKLTPVDDEKSHQEPLLSQHKD